MISQNYTSQNNEMKMKLFITVGTTSFDELVQTIDTEEFLEFLVSAGFDAVSVQYGRGEYVPQVLPRFKTLKVETFRFKPTLKEDMDKADVIVSHAGAGSIMESLRLKKRLIVVVNPTLMDNHQTEIAVAMQEGGYAEYCYPKTLFSTLKALETIDNTKLCKPSLKLYPAVDSSVFPSFLDAVVFGKKNN
eukprot:maker-scaffold_15-snap-gene-0.28-mRNA-1 protein AED:0.05 eAED:0.05 QI:55/1/1/1/0.33/0.25/4/124/189